MISGTRKAIIPDSAPPWRGSLQYKYTNNQGNVTSELPRCKAEDIGKGNLNEPIQQAGPVGIINDIGIRSYQKCSSLSGLLG